MISRKNGATTYLFSGGIELRQINPVFNRGPTQIAILRTVLTECCFRKRDKNFVKTPNWRNFWLFLSNSGNSGAEFPAISRKISSNQCNFGKIDMTFSRKIRQSGLPDWTFVIRKTHQFGYFTKFLSVFVSRDLVPLYIVKHFESGHSWSLIQGNLEIAEKYSCKITMVNTEDQICNMTLCGEIISVDVQRAKNDQENHSGTFSFTKTMLRKFVIKNGTKLIIDVTITKKST